MPHRNTIDQAMGLRNKIIKPSSQESRFFSPIPLRTSVAEPAVRVIAVSSGKGGVGKTNIVVNLAMAFDRMGKRVLIMDADLGLANVDILLGVSPKYNISHVLDGSRKLEEVLTCGPGNIRIMPASSGVQQLTKLSDEQKLLFLEILDGLENEVDLLLIDTGAGISDTVLYFNIAAPEKIIVVTPEPTSLTDAYALIKVLYTHHEERHFKILSNAVPNESAGKNIFAKVSKVADHFLDGLSLDYIGSIPSDPCVSKAIIQQKPLLEAFPQSPASMAFTALAEKLNRTAPTNANYGNIRFFWKRLLHV